MEACATAHHWACELGALGHEVRLMPPAYVKAYVKRNKNDVADAEAICEAVTRPTMRFVPIKSRDAQSVLMLHRARQLLVRQRTAQVSALRAHLAEYGIVASKGRAHVRELVAVLESDAGAPGHGRRRQQDGPDLLGRDDARNHLIAGCRRRLDASRRAQRVPSSGRRERYA
jgi:transposase